MDGMIKVDILYGCVKLDSWFETRFTESGEMYMVGMGSRTVYDQDGNITSHKVEPTGLRIWTH